jgi:hypothetical protein
MISGKYKPLSGACPLMVASLKFTLGDFYSDLELHFYFLLEDK